MSSAMELYEARVSYLLHVDAALEIHFSYAYIYQAKGVPGRDPGSGWSQEAVLLIDNARVTAPQPPLPNVVTEGYLQADDTHYDRIPLPFERKTPCLLHLQFEDGTLLEVRGDHPLIKLIGKKIRLDEFG